MTVFTKSGYMHVLFELFKPGRLRSVGLGIRTLVSCFMGMIFAADVDVKYIIFTRFTSQVLMRQT